MFSDAEIRGMELALQEAKKGGKLAFPNPLVGAVIIDSAGEVIASGHHSCCGAPHAERDVLSKAGVVSGMTMVVTLEPCCHHGRTPPCVEAIIASGIKRVVVAMEDPDPQVSGRGTQYLLARGLDVETGLLESRARELNSVYLHHRKTGRSFLHLKMAGTLDGRSAAADGSSRWVTCAESRKRVHEYRKGAHAVLIGGKTAVTDDPSLSARDVDCSDVLQPVRIVYTGTDLPFHLKLFHSPGRTVVACDSPVRIPGAAELWDGIRSPSQLLKRTADEGLGMVFCEGGATLAASLLSRRLVERISIFTAPALLGAEGVPLFGELGVATIDDIIRLQDVKVCRTGEDTLTEGRVVYRSS